VCTQDKLRYTPIINTHDKTIYENCIKSQPTGNFFQSWDFGVFQETLPYRGKVWALTHGKSACLAIKMKLPLGFCWLWVPYGPIGSEKGELDKVFGDLGKIAGEEGAIFARIEPPLDSPAIPLAQKWPITPSGKRFTPEHTLVLDLDKSEQEILAQMKPKGRYNINIAKKHGVTCAVFCKFEDIPAQDFNSFYEILQKTAQRDTFGIHPKYFYENLLKTLSPQNACALFLAYSGGKVVAGIITVYYKDTATYYFGASNHEYRSLMAPYLLQWEAICDAKKRGFKHYDFLGIAPSEAKNHPWAGVTDFKKKFGGGEVQYPPAFDIIYRPFLFKLMNVLKRA